MRNLLLISAIFFVGIECAVATDIKEVMTGAISPSAKSGVYILSLRSGTTSMTRVVQFCQGYAEDRKELLKSTIDFAIERKKVVSISLIDDSSKDPFSPDSIACIYDISIQTLGSLLY